MAPSNINSNHQDTNRTMNIPPLYGDEHEDPDLTPNDGTLTEDVKYGCSIEDL